MKNIRLKIGVGVLIVLIIIAGLTAYFVFKTPTITKPKCGNNICDINENWKNCQLDCDKPLKGFCGDKICESKEVGVCLADCPKKSVCGDGICSLNENCEEDCEKLPPPPSPVCGDNVCNNGETCTTCQADCGSCPITPSPSTGESHFGVQGAIVQFPQEMKSAGIEITREWIEWNRIEPTNNNYDWTGMDTKVQSANNAGIEILGYFISTPEWAKKNPACTSSICTINDMGEFREFAKNVAERYDGKHGYGEMKYIEILNEVSVPVFFEKDSGNIYSEWLIAGYEAAKQGNPDVKVLIGGFINPTNAEAFVRNMLQNYDNYYDIVNFHVYETEDQNTIATQALKGWMAEYNVNKPMWITETATAMLSSESDALNKIAKQVIKRNSRSFAEGVEKVFWFTFVGTPTSADGSYQSGKIFGLGWSVKGSAEFHPRSAYTAYKTMTSKLAGFSSVTKITDTQYKFIVNGRNVYVLWGSGNVPSEISGTVRVTDYLGNEQTSNASQIVLSDSPIFVE